MGALDASLVCCADVGPVVVEGPMDGVWVILAPLAAGLVIDACPVEGVRVIFALLDWRAMDVFLVPCASVGPVLVEGLVEGVRVMPVPLAEGPVVVESPVEGVLVMLAPLFIFCSFHWLGLFFVLPVFSLLPRR